MADKVTIEFDFHAAKALQDIQKSKKEIRDLEESWGKASAAERQATQQATRTTAWKVLTTDFDKLGESIERTSPRLLRFGQGITNVAGGVATGAAAVSGFGYALMSFAAHAQQTEAQVSRLGAAYAEVATQTNGAMSAGQALQLQGQIQAAGVQVNAHQLGLLARAAREFAIATGNDASEAVEKLTNAIVNNSEDALSELNLSQARASTSTQTLANMTAALEDRFRSTSPTARTLKEDLDKLPDAFTAIAGRALQESISGLERLANQFSLTGRAGSEFFQAARAGWREIVEAGDTIRNVERQSASTAAMNARLDARGRMGDVFAEGRVRLDEVSQANFGDLRGLTAQERARVTRAATPGMWAGDSASESVNRELRSINEERLQSQASAASSSAARAAMDAEVERKVSKTSEQLARAGESAEHLADRLNKAKAIAAGGISEFGEALGRVAALIGSGGARTNLQSMRSVLGLQSLSDEEGAEIFGGIADAQDGGGLARRDESARQQRRFARDRETRRTALAQGGGVGGAVARGLGVTGDALETQARMTQGYADTIVGAYGKIGDAITRHIELVASGQETLGQALLNGVHEVTKALAMEALPRALMETAAGFAALANPLTAATAPLHFTAAGVYGAVAAGAGLVAGVTGALGGGQSQQAGAGARATGAARSASGVSQGPPSGSAAPVTIVLSSLVPPGPGELQRLVDAGSQASRYNLDRRHSMVPRQVRA